MSLNIFPLFKLQILIFTKKFSEVNCMHKRNVFYTYFTKEIIVNHLDTVSVNIPQ